MSTLHLSINDVSRRREVDCENAFDTAASGVKVERNLFEFVDCLVEVALQTP